MLNLDIRMYIHIYTIIYTLYVPIHTYGYVYKYVYAFDTYLYFFPFAHDDQDSEGIPTNF